MLHFTTSDGLKLAYYRDDYTDPWHQRDTALMLHAAMGNAGRWFSMVPALARHFRLVRLDLRGHGASQVPPADQALTLERLVGDALELLDHLKLDRVHVFGNSAGGYIGQHMAMDHPQRVKSLVLFGSTPGLKNSQAASWVPNVRKKGLRPYFAETITDRFPPAEVEPGFTNWFLDDIGRNDPAFIGKWVLHMASFDWSSEVHRIKCPTLLVIPGAEPVGSVDNYEPMKTRIPDVEWVEYEGARHNICDYLPDRCAADSLAFLSRRFGGVNPHSPRIGGAGEGKP